MLTQNTAAYKIYILSLVVLVTHSTQHLTAFHSVPAYSSLFLPVTAMTPTKRHSHSHQLKNYIIQNVDSGSKLQKEYNLTSGNLSKWISSVNEISDKNLRQTM